MKQLPDLRSSLLGLVLLCGVITGADTLAQTGTSEPAPHPLVRLEREGRVTQRFFFGGRWHEETARFRRTSVLANHYVQEVLLDARGKESARRYFGWEAESETLTAVWMDDRSGAPTVASGHEEDSTWTLEGEEDFGDGLVPVRWIFTEGGSNRSLEVWNAKDETFESLLEERYER